MSKSELTKELEKINRPDYSDEELDYIKELQKRMWSSKEMRDTQHDEFDSMDYVTYYEHNHRLANTYLKPKSNKDDTNFQSGVIRQKIFALLSALINLNLSPDIEAYDKDGLEVKALGDAMEDIINRVNELDNDEEKKYLRFFELVVQGTVFVEEVWEERMRKIKKTRSNFDGKIKSAKWDERMEKAFSKPSRHIIQGVNVYLGDITKYDISDQPFIFTVDYMPYDEAKTLFGEWDRWKNVPRNVDKFAPEDQNIFSWQVNARDDDRVEIVRYQDKWNNESAVILNGVLMTPVGLPLPFGYEEYTIAQQNLEPIRFNFSYGKSLVSRIKNKVALLDEFQRLSILKTQKSFMPPYLNLSGRMLTSRVLMPGRISYGIPKDSLVPINDKETQGVSSSELAMVREIQESINNETTSPTFSGQEASGNPTATEVSLLHRQARMMLGLTVFAVQMLEWKLSWLRLKNISTNWFKDKRAPISTEKMIEGEGLGRRIIVPTSKSFTPEAVRQTEDILAKEQNQPIRLIFINPNKLDLLKLHWQISVNAREKKSSEIEKLLFNSFMQGLQPFAHLINWNYLSERYSSVWNENPQKLFKKQAEIQAVATPGMETFDGLAEEMLPNSKNMLKSQIKNDLGQIQ